MAPTSQLDIADVQPLAGDLPGTSDSIGPPAVQRVEGDVLPVSRSLEEIHRSIGVRVVDGVHVVWQVALVRRGRELCNNGARVAGQAAAFVAAGHVVRVHLRMIYTFSLVFLD